MLSLPTFFKPTPESLVRKLQDLPPEPKVLHTLQRLIAVPSTPMESIAEVVGLEPGLSARVVHMANSTHFGRGAPIENIMEAVQRVGLQGVHELVTFAVASQLIGQPLISYRMNAQSLWHRAVACALAAADLANRCDADISEAYTAGLMHGLGLMVIDRYAGKERKRRVFASAGYPLDFAPAEREWLEFSHAEAGAALLELWGFSDAVTMAVRHQLAPEAAPVHRQLCMILATARWARSVFCVADEIIPDLPDPMWMQEAGIEIGDFSAWLRNVRVHYTIACDELRLS